METLSPYLAEAVLVAQIHTGKKIKPGKLAESVKITVSGEEMALAALAISEYCNRLEQGGVEDVALGKLKTLHARLVHIVTK